MSFASNKSHFCGTKSLPALLYSVVYGNNAVGFCFFLPDLCYLIMVIKVKLSECLFCARLTFLSALSHLIHTQPCEAHTNVCIFLVGKEELSLRTVAPGHPVGRGV